MDQSQRQIRGPVRARLDATDPDPQAVTIVMVSEFVLRHGWERILPNRPAERLRPPGQAPNPGAALVLCSQEPQEVAGSAETEGRVGEPARAAGLRFAPPAATRQLHVARGVDCRVEQGMERERASRSDDDPKLSCWARASSLPRMHPRDGLV